MRLCILMLALATACGGAKQTATRSLATALTATNGARDAFVKWDKSHQLELVAGATTKAAAEAALERYRKKRQTVVRSFTIAYSTIAAAAAMIPLVEADKKPRSALGSLLIEAAQAAQAVVDAVKAIRGDP